MIRVLRKVLAHNFALSDEEGNTSEPLNSFFRICQTT